MKTIWIWVRDDSEPDTVLQIGSPLPENGQVYEVKAKNRVLAEKAVRLFRAPEPDRRTSREEWLDWDTAS